MLQQEVGLLPVHLLGEHTDILFQSAGPVLFRVQSRTGTLRDAARHLAFGGSQVIAKTGHGLGDTSVCAQRTVEGGLRDKEERHDQQEAGETSIHLKGR